MSLAQELQSLQRLRIHRVRHSLVQTIDPGGVVSPINLAPKFDINVSVLCNAANSGL